MVALIVEIVRSGVGRGLYGHMFSVDGTQGGMEVSQTAKSCCHLLSLLRCRWAHNHLSHELLDNGLAHVRNHPRDAVGASAEVEGHTLVGLACCQEA